MVMFFFIKCSSNFVGNGITEKINGITHIKICGSNHWHKIILAKKVSDCHPLTNLSPKNKCYY